MNQVLLSITKIAGGTYSGSIPFDPAKMLGIRQDGTAIEFDYPEQNGSYQRYRTGVLTLAAFQAAVNAQAPAGSEFYIVRLNSTSGFSIGAHDFLDATGNPVTLKDNSRVWSGFYEVITTFTSATDAATISFSIETDDVAGLKAATAISTGTTYDATGAPVLIIPQSSVATVSEKTTAARKLQYTIAGETVTAGELILWVEVVSEGL